MPSEEIEKSSAFALLQQGMSDKMAYRICLVVSLDMLGWEAFEQWAKDELKGQELNIGKAQAIIDRIARLNPDAGEIGPGMLASLVEDARKIGVAS